MSGSVYARAQDRMRVNLTNSSFRHCQRTAGTAARLAELHDEDVETARLAGLVHDVARELGDVELLAAAQKLELDIDPVELERPYLLHAAVGARILPAKTGIDDPRVIQAVARHTFGGRKMTNLDKIVYLADMIEPQREFAGIEELRTLAGRSLGEAFISGFKNRLIMLIEGDRPVHPRTLDVWNGIAGEVGERA